MCARPSGERRGGALARRGKPQRNGEKTTLCGLCATASGESGSAAGVRLATIVVAQMHGYEQRTWGERECSSQARLSHKSVVNGCRQLHLRNEAI
jgi:hypothetical protein